MKRLIEPRDKFQTIFKYKRTFANLKIDLMNVCVFCGSSMGFSAVYREAAGQLALFLAKGNHTLVYGGANVGLMKILADTMLEKGKKVLGVMPSHLVKKEVAHDDLTELFVVDSMAERKAKMVELSDVFIAMPGGFGTFDELTEILTFNQLRIMDKPLGILNVNNYFDLMLAFYDHAVGEGFVRKEHRENLVVSDDVDSLFSNLFAYKPLTMGKWLDDIKTERDHY